MKKIMMSCLLVCSLLQPYQAFGAKTVQQLQQEKNQYQQNKKERSSPQLRHCAPGYPPVYGNRYG